MKKVQKKMKVIKNECGNDGKQSICYHMNYDTCVCVCTWLSVIYKLIESVHSNLLHALSTLELWCSATALRCQ